jgi:tetratricopeptide (TPR) repeat protein
VEVGGVFLYRKSPTHHVYAIPPLLVRESRTRRGANVTASTVAPPPRTPAQRTAGGETSDVLAAVRTHVAAGRPKDALAAVEKILLLDGDNTEARLLAAHLFADMGDYDRALQECQRALDVNPVLPGARYLLGVIHQRQGDTAKAVSELKKTIYIDPEYVLAHLNLGNIYKGDARFADACRAYDNALRSLDKNPEGEWTLFLGGWTADVVVKTCERSLLECRKATGIA